jgi:UDP-glucuronate decarboxylase
VAGAAGFLGSHFCEKLLHLGHQVIGLDDLSTGSLSNLDFQRGRQWDFKFIEHDVRVSFDIKCDAIVNFACPASPIHYQADPIRTIETTFLGTRNLLRLAQSNSARFLQASTSEVYGDPLTSPQRESDWGNVNPIGIRSCYDEGKRAAESLCFDFKRVYNLDIRVMRIFNTYGPRMAENDGRVVSNFITQALQDKEITIYGDGLQTRSFCFVSDLIEGVANFLLSRGKFNTPINLGNNEESYVKDLANLIILLTKSNSKITYLPLPGDDPKRRKPDLSQALELLNYAPTIDLREGLNKTIDYFKHRL